MRGYRQGWHNSARWVIVLAASGSLVIGLATAATASGQPAARRIAAALAPKPAPARAPAFVARPRSMRLPAGERMVCGTPSRPGQMACQAVIPAALAANVPGAAGIPQGYSPASLQAAYRLAAASAHRGHGETIAIVDAYNNPDLARNLASYRRHFRLPACGTSSG